MKERKVSFAKRLSRSIVASITLLLVIMLFIMGVLSHLIIADVSEKSVANMLEASVKEMEENLRSAESAVQNVAWVARESLDNKDHLYYITRQTVISNPSLVGSAVALRPDYYPGEHFFSPYSYIDPDTGSVVTIQLGNEDYDYFYLDWYQIPALLGKPVWSEPYFDEGGVNQVVATYSYPLIDSDGELQGVVTADLSLEGLAEMISSVKPYDNSQIMMISRNGSFIATDIEGISTGETLLSYAKETGSDDVLRIARKMLNGEKGMERYNIGQEIMFAVFSTLSNGWSVSITCSYDEVLRRSSQMHLFIAILGLISLALLFLFCKRAISTAVTPIMDFSNAARKVADGDFDAELPEIKTRDEIGQLRDSFSEMQSSLKTYISELQSTTAKKERMESELHIAHEIQRVMSPQNFPKNDKVDLSAMVIPAREVGGDLYDFLLSDNLLFFSVGDVSGKGVPAAMFMALTCSSLRITSSLGLSMSQKINKVNDTISKDNATGMFVTLFAGKLDLNTGEMTYCNCGHNPMVVVEPGRKPYYLEQKANLTIGVWEGFDYQEQKVTFPAGTILVLYTDGVTEAERDDKVQYGEERLLEWASGISCESEAGSIADSLLNSVREFTCGNEQNDDITIMIIKF